MPEVSHVIALFQLLEPLRQLECLRQLLATCGELFSKPCVFRVGQGGWADPAAFPADMVRRLALYLDLDSVLTCRRVCRHWQRVIDSHESLWRREGAILGLEPPGAGPSCPEPEDSETTAALEAELAVQEAEHKLSVAAADLAAAVATQSPVRPLSSRRQSRVVITRRRVLRCRLGAPPRLLPLPHLLLLCPAAGACLTADGRFWHLHTLSEPPSWPPDGNAIELVPPPLPPDARLDAWAASTHHLLLGFGDRILLLGPGPTPLRTFELFPHAGLRQVAASVQFCVARAASHIVFWRVEAPKAPIPLALRSPHCMSHELLFLVEEQLIFTAWDHRTVNLVHYNLRSRTEDIFQAVGLNPLTDMATVRGVCAWSGAGRHLTVAIYGQRIGHVTLQDWREEGAAQWADISASDRSYRASDACFLVGAGRRLFVLWQPRRRLLQFYSRRVHSGPVRQLDLNAAALRSSAFPDFRFGPELSRGLACDRERPVVCFAQGLRRGSSPSVTVCFA